jgi:chromosome segregation ATPase
MADQSLPKNTIRLADFETRIKSLEEKTGIVDSTISEDSEKMKELKNSMLENKNEILQKLTESNEEITTKIKEQFKNDLDYGEKLYSQNLEDIERLKGEIEELEKKISEYETASYDKLIEYRKKEKELEDLKHLYEITKESYEDAAKENISLKKDLEKEKINISGLEEEIEDLKIVITRLIESRKILNKFFSTHYENFTEEEKKLIREIEGNVFPGYYPNNPVMPEIEENKNLFTSPPINSEKDLVNLKSPNNNNNNNQYGSYGILSQKEYDNYKENLKNNASPQIFGQNYMQGNRNYVGPDDDYWYEQNKKGH